MQEIAHDIDDDFVELTVSESLPRKRGHPGLEHRRPAVGLHRIAHSSWTRRGKWEIGCGLVATLIDPLPIQLTEQPAVDPTPIEVGAVRWPSAKGARRSRCSLASLVNNEFIGVTVPAAAEAEDMDCPLRVAVGAADGTSAAARVPPAAVPQVARARLPAVAIAARRGWPGGCGLGVVGHAGAVGVEGGRGAGGA